MMKLHKDMTIGRVLELYPELGEIFTASGMHCISCPCARAETIEEACAVHEIDVDKLMDSLNEAVE